MLRQQGGGHIVGVSSGLGQVAMPLIGFYCATKWAFEALHESLAQEVKAFGIKVTLVEPGAYATEFGSPASLKVAAGMDAYAGLREQVFGRLMSVERGDPQATPAAVAQRRGRRGPAAAFQPRQTGTCPWRARLTRSAWRPGKRGRPVRTPPRARGGKPRLRHPDFAAKRPVRDDPAAPAL